MISLYCPIHYSVVMKPEMSSQCSSMSPKNNLNSHALLYVRKYPAGKLSARLKLIASTSNLLLVTPLFSYTSSLIIATVIQGTESHWPESIIVLCSQLFSVHINGQFQTQALVQSSIFVLRTVSQDKGDF